MDDQAAEDPLPKCQQLVQTVRMDYIGKARTYFYFHPEF